MAAAIPLVKAVKLEPVVKFAIVFPLMVEAELPVVAVKSPLT